MAELAGAALALFLIWAVGALLLGALGLRPRRWPLGYAQPGIDFAAGCAVLATVWTLAALLGWRVTPGLIFAVALALAIPVGMQAVRRRRRSGADEHAAPGDAGIPRRRAVSLRRHGFGWVTWLAIACFLVLLGGLLIRAWYAPMFWDGRYIWGFKAKAMYLDGRLDRDAFTNLARYAYTHLDYPLAVPAAQAWVYQVLGRVDERGAVLVGVVFWLAIALLLASYLHRRLALPWAAGVSLLVCQLPLVSYHAGGGAADVPLAFCYLAAALLLAEWVEYGRREDSVLAALMFGICSLVKAEGLTMALGGALAFAVAWCVKGRRVTAAGAVLGPLALVSPYLPWAALRASWGIPSLQLSYVGSLPAWAEVAARLKTILRSVASHAISWQQWELAWVFVGIGFIAYLWGREGCSPPREVWARWRPAPAVLWGLCLWQFAVYVANYALSHYEIVQYLNTSLDRVMLHLLPLAIAAAVLSLARGDRMPASSPSG